ncbi:ferritin family protein [candidate division KSB1 bacterium]|nr:ferritin family protein [candidate division KSB1 bacterium]
MSTSAVELEGLQLALKMETDGYNFFKDAAAKTQNQVTKETFLSFAKWELEHVEFIKKTVQQLQDKGQWLSVDKMMQKKGDAISKVQTIFQQKHDQIDQHVKLDTSDLEAYALARGIEDKATMFYKDKAAKTTDEEARKFYLFMVEVEREHYKIFDNSYRYFENPALFNLESENWMFDGA